MLAEEASSVAVHRATNRAFIDGEYPDRIQGWPPRRRSLAPHRYRCRSLPALRGQNRRENEKSSSEHACPAWRRSRSGCRYQSSDRDATLPPSVCSSREPDRDSVERTVLASGARYQGATASATAIRLHRAVAARTIGATILARQGLTRPGRPRSELPEHSTRNGRIIVSDRAGHAAARNPSSFRLMAISRDQRSSCLFMLCRVTG